MSLGGRVDIAGQTVLKYQEIIDGVVGRVKPEFSQEGIDESVLDEVRALWEAKLVATGVIGEPSNEGQQVIQQQQLQQLHRPGLPVGAALGAGLPLHAQQQQFLAMRPGFPQGMPGMMPMGMPPQMMMPGAGGAPLNMAAMMQAQAMLHAQQAAAAAEQKRKLESDMVSGAPEAKLQRTIPQQDGPADDDGGSGAEGSAGGDEGAEGGAVKEEEEEDDDPLTEDDEEGSGDEVDEASVANVVLGQFEKVQRSKSKWKVVLKDCVLTLNGRDYLVHRCTGEMDF